MCVEAEACVRKQFGIEYPSHTPGVKAPAFSFKQSFRTGTLGNVKGLI
jgi:hypothetical protein